MSIGATLWPTSWRCCVKRKVRDCWCRNRPYLGGFGFTIDGDLYNLDTLKFYECLIALQKAGLLGDLTAEQNDRKIVVEIGGGWGGFAYQLKTLFTDGRRREYTIESTICD
jgi:hypothetical protein